jgi:lysyl-tRNA synthetase class 2
MRNVRQFFDNRAYLEVDTPILAPDLIPESCLEVFKTTRLPPVNSGKQKVKDYWLVPSPEIWMKKLIALHKTNMYQICKCFRNCESSGFVHSPEFTMLEYYTMDADYTDSLDITEALFNTLIANAGGGADLEPPFIRWTMDEAFSRLAGFSLIKKLEDGTLPDEARRLGLDIPSEMSAGDVYNLIFIHAVEPRLPKEKPVVLLDYPAAVPCLAKMNDVSDDVSGSKEGAGRRTRQRWELYARGIELANCYSEETDAEEVRKFFLSEQEIKLSGAAQTHAVDSDYWKIFLPRKPPAVPPPAASGSPAGLPPDAATKAADSFPRCSGVALGLDRLIMALTSRKTIDGILPFPMEPGLY